MLPFDSGIHAGGELAQGAAVLCPSAEPLLALDGKAFDGQGEGAGGLWGEASDAAGSSDCAMGLH